MASTVVLLIAAFLSAAVTVVFALLVVGVHAGDHPRHLTAAPRRGQLESSPEPSWASAFAPATTRRTDDARFKQIPSPRCHSGQDSTVRHFDAIRLSRPKE